LPEAQFRAVVTEVILEETEAAEMPGATREFEKLGVDYCCGGSRTLGEACAKADI